MPIQQISEKSIFALVIDYYYLCNKNCLIREYRCKHREGSVSKSLPLILFSSDYQIYILDSRFCYQKAAPKVSAGHLRRDRTAVLPERARKIYAVCAHPLRALEPPSDLFPPPVQCGDYCALRATVIICLRPHVAGLWSSDAMGACLPDQVKTHPLFRIGCAERGAILPVRVPEVVKTIYFLKKRARLFFNSQNYSIFALDFAE